jgi:hypothetical protein
MASRLRNSTSTRNAARVRLSKLEVSRKFAQLTGFQMPVNASAA